MSSTWADVAKGDDVVMSSRTYRVRKIKRNGKAVKVTVERDGRQFTSTVKVKAEVHVVKTDPLHDANGRQQRWAKKSEAEPKRKGLEPGDPAVTEPPAAPTGDVWDRPTDKIERKLDAILGAHLVGEASDEGAGYYVPPVDVTTVAAHLVLMHGGIPSMGDEGIWLEVHKVAHAAAANGGTPLPVNHWHTEKRP